MPEVWDTSTRHALLPLPILAAAGFWADRVSTTIDAAYLLRDTAPWLTVAISALLLHSIFIRHAAAAAGSPPREP